MTSANNNTVKSDKQSEEEEVTIAPELPSYSAIFPRYEPVLRQFTTTLSHLCATITETTYERRESVLLCFETGRDIASGQHEMDIWTYRYLAAKLPPLIATARICYKKLHREQIRLENDKTELEAEKEMALAIAKCLEPGVAAIKATKTLHKLAYSALEPQMEQPNRILRNPMCKADKADDRFDDALTRLENIWERIDEECSQLYQDMLREARNLKRARDHVEYHRQLQILERLKIPLEEAQGFQQDVQFWARGIEVWVAGGEYVNEKEYEALRDRKVQMEEKLQVWESAMFKAIKGLVKRSVEN